MTTAEPEPWLRGPEPGGAASLGLLFHAAEHAARHTGQIVTTAKVVRSRA